MEKNKVDMYLTINAKNFKTSDLILMREKLENMSEEKFSALQACELINPSKVCIGSLVAGGLGIDRFLVGDIGLGVLKLITAGGCGIWSIIDWFLIENRAKEKNFEIVSALFY